MTNKEETIEKQKDAACEELSDSSCSAMMFDPEKLKQAVGFRPWGEYPIGTRANAMEGGHWTKTKSGWKWHNGDTFATPGANVSTVLIP